MAARLSEDPDGTVAVLEAGEHADKYPASFVPLACFTLSGTAIDWDFKTVPQKKACQGLKEKVCFQFVIQQ